MDWIELIYTGSALIGGTLFLLRMGMMIVGGLDFGDSDLSFDMDADVGDALDGLDAGGDFDADFDMDGDIDHPSTELSFRFLSFQGLTVFFMMFGIFGLAIYRTGIWVVFSLAGGISAGLFTVWVMGLLFALLGRLQSEGTINLENAIGQQGSVYLTIQENGSGQIQVVVQGSLKIFDAVEKTGGKITTGEKIKVINVLDNKTLVVEKL